MNYTLFPLSGCCPDCEWHLQRKTRIDPHKYDYLHAEGPNSGVFEGWEYWEHCTCDACWFWKQGKVENLGTFAIAYAGLSTIREDNPDLDRESAYQLLIAEDEDCIF